MVINLNEDDTTVENAPAGLKTTRRKIMAAGVQIYGEYYFNREFIPFVGADVEVRYDVKDLGRVTVVLPDFRVVEADTSRFFAGDEKSNTDESLLKDSLRLTAVEGKNRLLLAACYQALEIRGIFAGLRDPLILVEEKNRLRERYTEIENNIRAAIKNGGDE